MLRGGKNLELTKGQEVVLVAVGAAYKTWEGGMNPDTGDACFFVKLCCVACSMVAFVLAVQLRAQVARC